MNAYEDLDRWLLTSPPMPVDDLPLAPTGDELSVAPEPLPPEDRPQVDVAES